MSFQHQPLTPRQLDVLRWIADDCPQDAWPDDSHKISARALETRNLVSVHRRDGRWHAQIKPDGAHYLTHGRYPDQPSAPGSGPPAATPHRPQPQHRHERDVEELIMRLRVAGPVRIESPSPTLRAAYRRTIKAAIADGKVPSGLSLRHTGRDHGDLVISLVQTRPVRPKPVPVPIPSHYDPNQPAIRRLLDDPARMDASERARPRAMRLIQGLADEARHRGHRLLEPDNDHATFRIDIDGNSFAFRLAEERERRDQFPADLVDAVRYDWQRVSPQPAMMPSGRLTLELLEGWRHPRWADRTRWTLQDKFPAVLELIEQRAAEARRQREAAAAERALRRQLWERAVPRARARYIYELNAERLQTQARASTQADELLAYCEKLAVRAAAEADPDARVRINQWLAWARARAEALDPLSRADELQHVAPIDVSTTELDRYMPSGMTVKHPPDED